MKFIAKQADIPHAMHELVVSETNLLSLLSKLYTPGSVCTIEDPTGQIRLIAEKDEKHYANRERGVMHPVTEYKIMKIKELLLELQQERSI